VPESGPILSNCRAANPLSRHTLGTGVDWDSAFLPQMPILLIVRKTLVRPLESAQRPASGMHSPSRSWRYLQKKDLVSSRNEKAMSDLEGGSRAAWAAPHA
jgi:hypothetical protein